MTSPLECMGKTLGIERRKPATDSNSTTIMDSMPMEHASVSWIPTTIAHCSSMEACISIIELLENILSFLDVKTLLHAQGVSRHFRDVIQGSLLLQRKLFLAPATFAEGLETSDGEREDLQTWCAPAGLKSIPGSSVNRRSADGRQLHMVNPAIVELNRDCEWHKWRRIFATGKSPRDETASLFRMYLAHPMPRYVPFQIRIPREEGTAANIKMCMCAYEDGLPRTFGKLLKIVEERAILALGREGATLLHKSLIRFGSDGAHLKLHQARRKIAT